MRLITSCLIAMFACAPMAAAQNTASADLDAVLRGWEKATGALQSFYAEARRTTIDKALGAKDVYTGHAMFTPADGKVGTRARLQLAKTDNANVYEKFILLWPDLYAYAPANSVVRVHPMLKNRNGPMQHSLLSFLLGMDAKEAQAKYKMHLDSGDKNYHLIRIEPKSADAKAEFTTARIAIRRTDHLLGQIWYRQPNGTDITWDFSNPQVNLKLDARHFEPDLPMGWRVEDLRPKVK
jgi:TIGR03009 family protein